ncbi:MAG: transposase DNA-binding-containing protein [Xenococcaceae cyanobacterium MO_188.B19]|nr:transposase DNA-binding-containing protein [Xenococcaceae cyanobacterium MO_188.B19]
MLEWWVKNFASPKGYTFGYCQLGDERLSNRAFSIGKILSQGFGKAFSEIFPGAKELKRAYEFLPTRKQNLVR